MDFALWSWCTYCLQLRPDLIGARCIVVQHYAARCRCLASVHAEPVNRSMPSRRVGRTGFRNCNNMAVDRFSCYNAVECSVSRFSSSEELAPCHQKLWLLIGPRYPYSVRRSDICTARFDPRSPSTNKHGTCSVYNVVGIVLHWMVFGWLLFNDAPTAAIQVGRWLWMISRLHRWLSSGL
jgi:hypothetical protein